MLKIFAPILLAGLVLGAPQAQAAPPAPPAKCPGLEALKNGDPLAAKVDAKMEEVVKALQDNKKSADALIAAAKDAGATPEALAGMEKMSQAFRQYFMSAVPPQQLVESILTAPATPGGPAGLVITAPDGSAWLVSPQMTPPAPPQPPRIGPGPRGSMRGPDMSGMPGIQMPNPGILKDPGLKAQKPFGQNAQPSGNINNAPTTIIMEESVEDMPYWPTKQHLGKDGVLNYLEKRSQAEKN